MIECTTGSHMTELLVGFVLLFAVHAAPLTYLFVRWGHRYYWGFFPSAFSAMAFVALAGFDLPCAIIQTEFLSVVLGAVFVSISYLSLIFFKPDLHFLALFAEAHVPAVLAMPVFGALYAAVWLLLSVGRDRLLMDSGETVSFKMRLFETLAHGVLAAAGCVLVTSVASQAVH